MYTALELPYTLYIKTGTRDEWIRILKSSNTDYIISRFTQLWLINSILQADKNKKEGCTISTWPKMFSSKKSNQGKNKEWAAFPAQNREVLSTFALHEQSGRLTSSSQANWQTPSEKSCRNLPVKLLSSWYHSFNLWIETQSCQSVNISWSSYRLEMCHYQESVIQYQNTVRHDLAAVCCCKWTTIQFFSLITCTFWTIFDYIWIFFDNTKNITVVISL